MTPPARRRRTTAALALLTAAVLPGLTQLPAVAGTTPVAAAGPATGLRTHDGALHPDDVVTLGDPVAGLADVDVRDAVAPLASQRAAAASLGDVDLRWNASGTPSSILPADGVLGPDAGTPEQTARAWLADHAGLFGSTAADLAGLVLVNAQSMPDTAARAVLLRQDFGGLAPARGGLVTVGIAADGTVAYVSSSLARTTAAAPAASLSPLEGWVAATRDVRPTFDTALVDDVVESVSGGWTRLRVPGFAQEQQVRLRALPMPDGAVRPVFEANVVDTEAGDAFAYTSLVDAVTGDVLVRQNQVENAMYNDVFTGSVTATSCGEMHTFELDDDLTRSINAVGVAAPTDDITIKLFGPGGDLLLAQDLLTSPEVLTYTADTIPAGVYSVQVCPFDAASVVVGQYALTVTTSDQAAPETGGGLPDPRWRYFTTNPAMTSLGEATPTNSVIGCWVQGAGCTTPTGPFRNPASVGPWDTVGGTVPTLTTVGNNANTHEAWASPLTPGGFFQAPVSPTRDYTAEFTDAWNNSRCDPAQLVPGGNDIDASVGNLFVSHNRMHDYSYYLGFTEENYNLQLDNHGRGGVGGDQEIGNAQAGALTGATYLTGLGRDNANQIALQDGIPGITNQYLFQPIAGAFYAPCTDGGLDMGIVGHEYTHAISNRMVAGPDEGLTSEQGGAMGESWSDLVAAEYEFSHGYDNGGNIWAVGVYATGNKSVAIRDYSIDKNPLNYSDYGFDTTGAEVHADGEIWNGTQWSVRQALVRKWNARFPYADERLQLRCAQGDQTVSPLPANLCPGNRRWVQLMFDSFLLQQGATSMLDARDAMLAADRMRFGGKNQKVMWKAFAQRGMGKGASVPDADSEATVPSFASPRQKNGTVRFTGAAPDTEVYVGHYEARATPVADLSGSTRLGSAAAFVPGRYEMLAVSEKQGFRRFTMTVRPGVRTVRIGGATNLAAKASGASVLAATEGSRNAAFLIDGTEATNWGGVTAENVDVSHPSVSVDLAGGRHTIRRVQVSALLTPAPADPDALPLAVDEDPDSGSRFTALRKFAIEVCTSGCSGPRATWKRVFVSPADAFPGKRPRPVAPDQTMRSFRIGAVKASAVRLVTLENQCTGFAGYAGESDADPLNDTDCATASDRGTIVHAAELQVFTR